MIGDLFKMDEYAYMELLFDKNSLNKINSDKKESKFYTTGKGTGMRFNQGKLMYNLVEPNALRDMVDVLTYGATKYRPKNWKKGLSWTSVIDSLKRHIEAFEAGEDYDKESGKLHIAHAACNIHYLNEFYYCFPQGDDREKKFLKLPKIGLDVDGIISDFSGGWHELYNDVPAKPTSWYCDRKMFERFEKMKEDNMLNQFYLNLKPLLTNEELPFEPHCYITARPVSREITEQWLDKYDFPRKPVYSVDAGISKVEVAKTAGIEVFIDDSYDNFIDLNNNGIFTYLYTQSWNKRYDVGHMRLKSLKDLPLLK